ncbi:MAG: hypothetical protein V1679_01675 [Candidatus Peregrinibacteria bacterium]
MALKADYEFLFVGRDDNSFLENYSYDLFQEHGDKSGQIFITLEVQNNVTDAEEIGNAIYETMQKVFFEDVERDAYERFEVALKAVNGVLNQFKEQKTSGYIGNLNAIVAAVVDDALYLSQAGDAEAYLIRKRYVSIVSEGLSDEERGSADVFTNIASGNVEYGDFILFSSTRLLRYISKTDLAKSVSNGNIAEILDEIKDVISTEMLGKIGLTGIIAKELKEGDIRQVEEQVDSATRTILESSEDYGASEKKSVTGRFFSAIKRRSAPKGFSVNSFGNFFRGIGEFFKGIFSGGFGRNKILALLVVVILALGIGIVVAKSNLQAREEIQRLDDILVSVQEKLAEAETKGSYDKETAKQILDKAYEDTISVLNSGYYRDKAILYLGQIDEARDTLDNVQRVDEPKVLADLSEKRSDVNALGFVEVNDRIFIYEYNALYELVLDQVQDPLTIDDEETVIAATGFDDRNSVVFLTKSGKMIEYRNGTMAFMDTDDGSFHRGVAIEDWSNRIYLMDTANNQIWKYTYKGTRDKFGNAEEYFVESGELDISNARDFSVDGSLYVLNNNGDVYKFYAGSKVEFYINDAPFNAFKDPTLIYTNEKVDEVYILDASEARVLVFVKDKTTGNVNYKTQYLFDGAGELRDLYVDQDARKMYVLTSSKVLEVEL